MVRDGCGAWRGVGRCEQRIYCRCKCPWMIGIGPYACVGSLVADSMRRDFWVWLDLNGGHSALFIVRRGRGTRVMPS